MAVKLTTEYHWRAAWPYGVTSRGPMSFFQWSHNQTVSTGHRIHLAAGPADSGTLFNSFLQFKDSENGANASLHSSTGSTDIIGTPYPTDESTMRWFPEAAGYHIRSVANGAPCFVFQESPRVGYRQKTVAGETIVNGITTEFDILSVGRNIGGVNYRQFTGTLGPLGIWNRLLTEADVAWLASGGHYYDVPDLIHLWTFDKLGDQPDRVGNLPLTLTAPTSGTPALVASPPWQRRRRTIVSMWASAEVVREIPPMSLYHRLRAV